MKIYLASPYSHPDPAVRQQRFEAVCEWVRTARMWYSYETDILKTEVHFISPIEYTHPFAVAYNMPNTSYWWRKINYCIIDQCAQLWVLKLDGWEQSEGVKDEIKYAKKKTQEYPNGKTVRYEEGKG